MTIKLGLIVKDLVTGITGVAENRGTYMHGCDRYCIQPKAKKDGTIPEAIMVDEPQLRILTSKKPAMEPMKPPKQILFNGDLAIDPISGFKGIVTGRAVYLNGCARTLLSSKKTWKDGEEDKWFDEPRLDIVKKALKVVTEKPAKRTGGPCISSKR